MLSEIKLYITPEYRRIEIQFINPVRAANFCSAKIDPERAIKSDEQKDFMRIEGPISSRSKGLCQIFPHCLCEERQRRDEAIQSPYKCSNNLTGSSLSL
jgi:hypothetical protein